VCVCVCVLCSSNEGLPITFSFIDFMVVNSCFIAVRYIKSNCRIVLCITTLQLLFVEFCFCNLKPSSNISIYLRFVYCHLQNSVLAKVKLGPLSRARVCEYVCVCVCLCVWLKVDLLQSQTRTFFYNLCSLALFR